MKHLLLALALALVPTVAAADPGKPAPASPAPAAPMGQLRGAVVSHDGKHLAGVDVKVTPGDHISKTDADGKFQLDLAPGKYQLTITGAPKLDVTIANNGVTIKNVELTK